MSSKHSASRRDFLKGAFLGAAVLRTGVGRELLAAEQGAAAAKSKVVVARDALLRGTGSTVDSKRMLALLDRAMQALFDRDRPIEAWKMLVHPGDLVGVKVNTLGGRGISSNLQLVEAICERLQEAGIRAGDIVGPRDGRTGTRRIPYRDRRKRSAVLRHRPGRLRAGSG